MFKKYIFNKKQNAMLILLNDWKLIKVSGIDAKKYLQGKLTSDIFKLNSQKHIFTAHCNSKGKVLSTLHLFHNNNNEGFYYILRSSVLLKQLNEFKKYSIFSRVTFSEQHNTVLLGFIGYNSKKILKTFFSQIPNKENSVIYKNNNILLYFDLPVERFLLITDNIIYNKLMQYFHSYGDNSTWLALNFASGMANIDIENMEKFFPQELNLQCLSESISFNKGCYSGQEMITRIQYLCTCKQSMFCLTGESNKIPKIGTSIESQINNAWRRVGTILGAVKLTDTIISIQLVLNNDINKNNLFRLSENDNNILFIQSLPY